MATLKAQNFNLEFSYYDLNDCNEIEYSFDIKLNGKPFFNPDILSKKDYFVKDEKFIVGDCLHYDWLMTFFIDILKTKKGGRTEVLEPPELDFEVITWEDHRAEKEKSWEGKTCAVGQSDGTITHEPYAETMKMFIPLWEDKIEFIIHFPDRIFDTQEYTAFKLSVTTTLSDLIKFVEEFDEEMRAFYRQNVDKVKYLGSGQYEELEITIKTKNEDRENE